MIQFRTMDVRDIAAGEALCRAANWNQLRRDWELFLKLNPAGGRVVETEGKIVGTVTTLDYEQHFSWIGMVLVDPGFRGQGIGTALLKKALEILEARNTVKLDATPAGREVYLKLDFKDEYKLSRMIGSVQSDKLNMPGSIPLSTNDMDEVSAFDRKIFGADRRKLLEWQLQGAKEYAFIEREGNEIVGYCMGRHGYNFEQIGPVLALNADIAVRLANSALLNCKGRDIAIDAMHFDVNWMKWLTGLGLKEQRPFVRMYRGIPNEHDPLKQFGIMGPEFG